MIKIVEFKECTCDFCGKRESIPKEHDMPHGWAWMRLLNPENRNIVIFHTCTDCCAEVAAMIVDMKERKEHENHVG